MIDIKRGRTEKNATSERLVSFFRNSANYEGKLYIGYPILYTGGESIVLDALWLSETYGVVIFDLVEGIDLSDRSNERDNLYNKIRSLLTPYNDLSKRRKLLVEIQVVTYAPAAITNDSFDDTAREDNGLKQILSRLPRWESANLFSKVLSIIQSVIQIKAKIDRAYIQKTDSKGAIVKRLEETIANLDNQQEDAIIEYHDGLQRIRGLAGSGKTIVLALKAAYLHALNPTWNIAVTFNTRSLKNQFIELIELFCIQKMGRKPDEDKIRVIHAWGSSSNPGVYYEFCKDNGIEYLDFKTARTQKSYSAEFKKELFDYVCSKALTEKEHLKISVSPKYDAILVDEAQDLSESFLNLCYLLLDSRKRLIYAYDELQKLNEGSSLRNPRLMFGKDGSDIILKKCYRNSRPVLVTAHALGFGIYRKDGLAQFFDQPQLWKDVGYNVMDGKLEAGSKVTLNRTEEATHKYLETTVGIDDIIQFKRFNTKEEQALELANEIKKNIHEDELLERDIVVINPLALTTKDEIAIARSYLNDMGINSHIAGDANPDLFFEKKSITFTGINRAKGNEVPMVYIINAQDCYSHPVFKDLDLIKRRNILFTAITRSKAWVRVYGIGASMDSLIYEFHEVKRRDFVLQFKYPTIDEIQKMNIISRDLTKEDELKFGEEIRMLNDIQSIVERIKSGNGNIEDYPQHLQLIIQKLMS